MVAPECGRLLSTGQKISGKKPALTLRPLLAQHIEVAAGFFEEAIIDNLGDGEWLGDF